MLFDLGCWKFRNRKVRKIVTGFEKTEVSNKPQSQDPMRLLLSVIKVAVASCLFAFLFVCFQV